MQPEVQRRVALGVVVALIAGTILLLEGPWSRGSTVPPPPSGIPPHLAGLPGAADFRGATGWLNTPNSTGIDLVAQRGKVVLVDFWTYSCINCIRTFPYLRAWNDHYADDGLVIVGVHTPEFRFERDKDNVRRATEKYDLTWPMALDNDFGIWRAYSNHYWPSKYLVDQYGKIRYNHFGEGDYVATEDRIRALLDEAGFDVPRDHVKVDANENTNDRPTPELYAAGSRNSIANPEGYQRGKNVSYADPGTYSLGRITLAGTWYNDDDHVRAVRDAPAVHVRFKGAGGNFVAGGLERTCIQIELDGAPMPMNRAGADVRESSGGTCVLIDGPRSYDFYAGPFEEHVVTLRPPPGFELYTFVFSSSETTT